MATSVNNAPRVNTKTAGRPSKSPTQMAVRRFFNNKLALISSVVLLLIILACIGAPLIDHWSWKQLDFMNTDSPPSAAHLLGTNDEGADYLSLNLYGGRIDLLIGFMDTALLMIIGIVLGGVAGYYGGWVDSVIMRICDLVLNFPFLLLIIIITAILNHSSVWLLIGVIAAVGWPPITRLVRSLFMSLRESEYVLAAKMSGAGMWRIIFKHLLPNSIGPLIVTSTLLIAGLIGTEAALSIIGFGIQPPQPSWGNILANVEDLLTMQTEPWAWIPAAVLITLTIICINFIGDGLRDAFDPNFER
jgi:peptide/nickel transport system permease protein